MHVLSFIAALAPLMAAQTPEPTDTASDATVVEKMSNTEIAACAAQAGDKRCESVKRVCNGDEKQPEACNSYHPALNNEIIDKLRTAVSDEMLESVSRTKSTQDAKATATEPPRSDGGRKLVNLPGFSPDLVADIRRCVANSSACGTLSEFKDQSSSSFGELRLWCTRYAPWGTSPRWQPGVGPVCEALGKHSDAEKKFREAQAAVLVQKDRAEQHVAQAAVALASVMDAADLDDQLSKAQAAFTQAQAALATAQQQHPGEQNDPAVRKAQAELDKTKKALDQAKARGDLFTKTKNHLESSARDLEVVHQQLASLRAGAEGVNALAALKSVDSFELERMRTTLEKGLQRCGGFGLTLPLFSFRHVPQEYGYSVKGPVEAGIGGGYYHDVYCDSAWTWGPEFFLISEGLDPSRDFHIAAAAGVSIAAFKFFHFGLAFSYDLVRHRVFADGSSMTNGLFTRDNGYGRLSASGVTPEVSSNFQTNLALLFTFSLVGQSGDGSSENDASSQTNSTAPTNGSQ